MKQKLLLLFAVLSASLSAWAGNTITYTASEQLSLSSIYFTPGYTSHTYDAETQTGTLTFPSDVTKIGNWAFQNMTALNSIDFPNTVTEIGVGAFMGCTGLSSIDFKNSVTTIGARAFEGCTSLTTITIPNSVVSLGSSAFSDCTNLSTVIFQTESLTTFENYLFSGCTSLSTINIPNSIISIGELAFKKCGLTSVTIPNSVTSIGKSAFNECSNMTEITIGSYVQTIGDNAFYKCTKLASITLPASVNSLGNYAFQNCSNLRNIYSLNPTPPTLGGTKVFDKVSSLCNLNVPVEGYMAYKEADQWKGFSRRNALAGTLALNDETEYTIDQNVTGCTLSYTRTVTSDNWMGVYLPFEVDVTKVEGTYATLTDVSDGILEWTTVESGTISWGTPFIFKPTEFATNEESRVIVFTSSDGTLHKNTDVHPKTIGEYKLAGTYLTKTDMQGKYGLANGNFYIGGSTAQPLKPYRIFLTVPASVSQSKAPVRSRINGVDATGIEELTIEPSSIDNCMFNLQGVRVDDNYKGIVIVNGKKVIRK